MPRTIDDKIVEMRFDNRDFEKNTKQSMATLDKLKTSLDMSDAERNFNKISKASDDVSFSKASSSVDTFSVKLSAMSSVAVAAIGRITNSLFDMGEQLVRNMLGIDEVRAGFAKYEENIGYQQTMLLSSDLTDEAMQELLDKLEWFSDETSFEMSSLMRAMSSYMANGADEMQAQAAAMGTALWAAFSGNSNEALSSANYALPQVFTRGMTREIWRMISNAKMDIPKIRQLFMETAEEVGTLKKVSEGVWQPITEEAKGLKKVYTVTQENFLEAMTPTAWLNKDVYLKAMAKISKFTDTVYDEYERLEGKELTFDIIGRLGEVGDAAEDLGYKALKAAQETKTWSETWEYIKKAITGGWSTTFETVIGDFSKARDFFSKIVESLYSIFITSGANRNNLLSGWAEYTPEVAKDLEDVAEKAEKVETVMKNVRDVVLSIIRGNYNNGSIRIAALAEEFGAETGAELQHIVNQVWKQWDGPDKKWSLNYQLLDQLTAGKQISSKTAEAIKTAAEVVEDEVPILNGRADFLDGIAKFLSGIGSIKETIDTALWGDEENEGALSRYFNINPEGLYEFTHKISEWMRNFGKEAEGFDATFVHWLVKDLSIIRDILVNLFAPVKQVFGAFKDAFKNTFFSGQGDPLVNFLYRISEVLTRIKEFTARLEMSDERVEKLRRIFEGLLTPIKIVGKIIGSIFSAVDNLVNRTEEGEKKSGFIDKLLDLGDGIASIITGFSDWLDKTGAIDKFITPAVNMLSDALKTVWEWFTKIFHLNAGKGFPTFDDLFAGWKNIKNWLHEHIIQPINDFFNIDLHIPTWEEIAKGWGDIKGWISEHIVNPFSEFIGKFTGGKEIKWPTWDGLKAKWKDFKDWFHNNVVAPFEQMTGIDLHFPTLDEVKDFFGKIWDWVSKLFGAGKESKKAEESVKEQSKSWEAIGNIFGFIFNLIKQIFQAIGQIISYLSQNETMNKVLNAGLLGGFLGLLIKLIDAFTGLSSLNPLDFLNRIGDGVRKLMIASANQKNAEALKQVAISVGILVGSLILLSLLPVDQLQNALATLVEITGIIAGLLAVLSKFSSGSSSESAGVTVGSLFDTSTWSGNFGKKTTTKTYDSLAIALLEIAGAIAVMAVAIRIVAKLNPSELRTGLFAIEELMFMIVGAMAVLNSTSKTLKSESSKSLFGDSHSSEETIGQVTIQFISLAILISALASAIKKLSTIPNFDTSNAAYTAIVTLLAMIEGLIFAVTKVASKSEGNGKKTAKATAPLMAVLFTIVSLVLTIAYVAKNFTSDQLDAFDRVAKWVLGITIVVGLIAVAIVGFISKATPKTPKETEKGKIIKMAAAIAIITAAMSVLILSLTAAMAVMLSMIKEGLTDKQMDLVSEYMRILLLAVVVVAGFAVGLALMAGKMSNSDFKNLLGLSAMVAALSAGISLLVVSLSTLVEASRYTSLEKMAVVMGGVALIVLILVGMLAVIISELKTNATMSGGSGSSTFLKFIGLSVLVGMLATGISLIVLAMAKLAETGDWAVILTTAGAITLVVLAIMAFMATMLGMTKNLGGSGGGDFARLVGLTMAMSAITLGLSVLVLSLSKLAQSGDIMTIVATLGMFSLLILALTVMLAGLSAIEANSGGSVMKVGAAFLGIAAGMALLSLGLGEIIKNTAVSPGGTKALWQAVLALTALMAVITIAAAIAGIPMVTAGFTAISVFFVAVGSGALMVAAGLALIVTALTKFKDAIYDIGENSDRFGAGLDAIIVGVATAIKDALPKLLTTIQSALTGLPTTLVDLIISLLKTLNERTPEIIAQVAESIIRLLSSLSQYIGPIVATLFDFIVNALEGLAFAINKNAGRITAAIMDVLVSIVVLTNTALSGLLSSIFHFIGLDFIGDKITEVFGWISKKSVKAFSAAGDDVIKTSEDVSKDVINSSPRLAEYYTKYGDTISNAIGDGTEGITSMLGLSGEKITDATDGAFGNLNLSSLTGGFSSFADGNFNFDLSSLKSFGDAAGVQFSDGVAEGIKAVEISKMFPTAEEFLQNGKEAGEAALSGYGQSLYMGLLSGKFKTMQEVTDYIEAHGIQNEEGIEAVYSGIADGTITNARDAIDALNKYIDAEGKKANATLAETAWNKLWTETDDNGVSVYKPMDPRMLPDYVNETGEVLQRQDDINGWISTLIEFSKRAEEFGAVGNLTDDTVKSLNEFKTVLSAFGWSEYQDAIKIIDYLIGLDEKPDESVYSSISAYLTDWERKLATKAAGEVFAQTQNAIAEQGSKMLDASGVLFAESYFHDQREKMKDAFSKLDSLDHDLAEALMVYTTTTDKTIRDNLYPIYANFVTENDDNMRLMEWLESEVAMFRDRGPEVTSQAADFFAYFNQVLNTGTSGQKYAFNNFVSLLAQRIPETVELYEKLFGIEIEIPQADWSKIIGDPSSINMEQFKFLMSYMYLLGGDVADSYMQGLMIKLNEESKSPEYTNAVTDSANKLPRLFKDQLEIKSPSRVGADIGKNFVLGVAEGVEDTADEAGLASEETALSMAQRLKDAISAAVGFNLEDLSPVIRPILDLDAITAGASQINGLVGGNMVYGRFGVGPAGYGDLQAIAQMNKTGLAQAIQESVLTQPVNQTLNNTFNIQSNDPNEVARRVSAILSSQVQRKQQVWGPAKVNRATQ